MSSAEIVIIGAGAAGISAGARLVEHGITNFKILEAEDRIGGRIHSVWLGDAFVDLGAEEVHGDKGNIIAKLAGEHLRTKKSLTKSTCYYSDGKKVDEDICEEVMSFIELFCDDDSGQCESIGKVFTERYTSNIISKNQGNPEKCARFLQFLPLCESFFSILDGPFSWYDVVLESASHYVDCNGDQFIGWDGYGCQKILDKLIEEISNEELRNGFNKHIHLNKTVERILWNSPNKLEIFCEDGSVFRSDIVIFTPSIGVLKNDHARIFHPSLPKRKLDALRKIGFASVMKVALEFPRKWWYGAPFGFVWRDDKTTQPDPEVSESTELCKKSIHWLIEAPENDHVLVAWLTGPLTPKIEILDDNAIREGIMNAIKIFLGPTFDIPEPTRTIATRWCSNPKYRGTYSYETIEASQSMVPLQQILEEPLTDTNGLPVILFAGEATHTTQFSTVNGAILSGYREADRILELFRDKPRNQFHDNYTCK